MSPPSEAASLRTPLRLVNGGQGDGRVFTQEQFLDTLPGRVEQMLDGRDQVLLLLSGPSGSGKTTLAQAVEDLFRDRHDLCSLVRLELDEFFGDTRQDRHRLVQDPATTSALWWAREYNWDRIIRVLGRLRAMGRGGGDLFKETVYKKDGHFHDDPESIHQPVSFGKKLILAPGFESYLAAQSAGYTPDGILRTVIHRPFAVALEAALLRDAHDRKISLQDPRAIAERLAFRANEYHFQEPVHRDVLAQPDVTIVDNSHLRPDWNLLAEFTEAERTLFRAILTAWHAPRLSDDRP